MDCDSARRIVMLKDSGLISSSITKIGSADKCFDMRLRGRTDF